MPGLGIPTAQTARWLIAILDGDTYNYSIELLAKFPLRVNQYAYNVGGVGHGKFRGGLA